MSFKHSHFIAELNEDSATKFVIDNVSNNQILDRIVTHEHESSMCEVCGFRNLFFDTQYLKIFNTNLIFFKLNINCKNLKYWSMRSEIKN